MNRKLSFASALIAVCAALTFGTAALDAGTVHVGTKLNVRAAPSTTSSVKTTLQNGNMIMLLSAENGWWRVEYAPDAFGYVSSNYVTAMGYPSATVQTAGGRLNVRSGPGTSYSVVGSLARGENVVVLGTYGNFSKILYDGNRTGYVSSAYLKVSNAASGSSYTAVTLSVPSYKQYDKAYASLKLPGSGESVYTHGCAVTSFAMEESYRTGKTVTPKNVIAEQSFTSTGALYWPAPYTRGETTYAYLYKQLAAGKPVIVHVKKASGATHFVTVYGFSGGTLAAANFKINDPGSATRNTLADLLAVYPTIVKTLSY